MSQPKDSVQPFENFEIVELDSEKLKRLGEKEGKQEKGTWTGEYKDKKNKKSYIKKSKKYPADNLAEVITSLLLQELIDEHAVPYDFINCNEPESSEKAEPDNDYLICPFYEGCKTLKEVAKEKFPGRWVGAVGADVHTDANKEKLYNSLSAKQKAQLADILAACALLLERDTQRGNIIFYKKEDDQTVYLNPEEEQENKEVGKFDNSWGLAGICLPEQVNVDIFNRRLYMLAREGEGESKGILPRTIPTNHYNDFPRIIHSDYFINALDKIIKKSREKFNQMTVYNTINRIKTHFPEAEHKTKFIQLADHLGILTLLKKKKTYPNEKEFKNMDADEMELYISNKLKKRLESRTKSLEILKSFISLEIHYRFDAKIKVKESDEEDYIPLPSSSDYDPEKDLINLKNHLERIQRQINEKFQKISIQKNKAKKTVTFDDITKKLPAFNENIYQLLKDSINKYRSTPNHNQELVKFFDDLLKIKPEDRLIKHRDLKRKRLDSKASPLQLFDSRKRKKKKGDVDEKCDRKHFAERNASQPVTALSQNKYHQLLEDTVTHIIEKVKEMDDFSKKKLSYKKTTIKPEEAEVVIKIDNVDNVSIKNKGEHLHIQTIPLKLKNTNIDKNNDKDKEEHLLQIKLFAQALVETGDPHPKITNGNAKEIILLLKELKNHRLTIQPDISSNIEFSDNEEKIKNKLLDELKQARRNKIRPSGPEGTKK